VANVKECRFVVDVDGDLRKVCRIVFPKNDASLYLIPYGRNNRYWWGEGRFAAGQQRATFKNRNEAPANAIPKLSIHESGQVHVKTVSTGDYEAGPLHTGPLWKFRGEHLASISIDSLQSLPLAGKKKAKPKSPDFCLRASDVGHSRRFALYANGKAPDFAVPTKARVTMNRAGLPAPLHIGIEVYSQEWLAAPDDAGVTIIAGWKADSAETLREDSLLWVRAL